MAKRRNLLISIRYQNASISVSYFLTPLLIFKLT